MDLILEANRALGCLINDIAPLGINPYIVARECYRLIEEDLEEALSHNGGYGDGEYLTEIQLRVADEEIAHELSERLKIIFNSPQQPHLMASMGKYSEDDDTEERIGYYVKVELVTVVPLEWRCNAYEVDFTRRTVILSEEDCGKKYGGHDPHVPFNRYVQDRGQTHRGLGLRRW